MISVVIPTFNAAQWLPLTLKALSAASGGALVREIVISDGGSSDATLEIARSAGVRIVESAKGRGAQLARGAEAAQGDWLLFLHADTRLDASWTQEVSAHFQNPDQAGVFTLKFDSDHPLAKLIASSAMVRTRLFKAPYGDQGLLVSRALYDDVGGYADRPLFEDVDIVDRLVRLKGRKVLKVFRAHALTSAERYRTQGYGACVLRNFACLAMYRFGVSPTRIAKFYYYA
jgi:rSAM/selenodomain-associated transferase 2